MEFFSTPELMPFIYALAMLLVFGVIELVLLLAVGSPAITESLDSALDSALDVDVDGSMGGVFDWVLIRAMPLTLSLSVLFGGFAMAGFIAQGLVHTIMGSFMDVWAASSLGVVGSLAAIRGANVIVRKLKLDQDTSQLHSPVGNIGYVQEEVVEGIPALVHVTDKSGSMHMISVLPLEGEVFSKGQSVEILFMKPESHAYIARKI